MDGWSKEERRDIERAALNKNPKGAAIAASIAVALVAVPVLVLWAAAMLRLWQWAF